MSVINLTTVLDNYYLLSVMCRQITRLVRNLMYTYDICYKTFIVPTRLHQYNQSSIN